MHKNVKSIDNRRHYGLLVVIKQLKSECHCIMKLSTQISHDIDETFIKQQQQWQSHVLLH